MSCSSGDPGVSSRGEAAPSEPRSEEAGDPCPTARKVYRTLEERFAQQALEGVSPSELAKAKTTMKVVVEEFDRVFDEVCREAEETTTACLRKMEDFAEAEIEASRAREACGEDWDCRDEVREAFEARLGDCKVPLDAFRAKVMKAAEPAIQKRRDASKGSSHGVHEPPG